MGMQGIMLSEITDRKENAINFTYQWNLKCKINKQNRNRLIYKSENIVKAVRWDRVWGQGQKGEQIKKYKRK